MAGLRAIVRLITRHHNNSPQPGRKSINKQNQFKRDLSELSLFWAGARGRLLSAAEVQAVCCQLEILNRRKVVLWLCKKKRRLLRRRTVDESGVLFRIGGLSYPCCLKTRQPKKKLEIMQFPASKGASTSTMHQ